MSKIDRPLLKKIGKYDLSVGITITTILYLVIGNSSLFFLLGIFHAYVNFLINSACITFLLLKRGMFKNILNILGHMFRILLVCITSIIIIKNNELNFFIYIIGYTAQIGSIVMYGVRLNLKERKR